MWSINPSKTQLFVVFSFLISVYLYTHMTTHNSQVSSADIITIDRLSLESLHDYNLALCDRIITVGLWPRLFVLMLIINKVRPISLLQPVKSIEC